MKNLIKIIAILGVAAGLVAVFIKLDQKKTTNLNLEKTNLVDNQSNQEMPVEKTNFSTKN